MASWTCKKHKLKEHDVFINYRVASDADLAQKLACYLQNEKKQDNTNVTVFLDKFCLNDGEDWEVGFLNGLDHAALLVLLISEKGLENIRNADKRQDNVLLEYEMALEKLERGEALVLPVLVDSVAADRTYKHFSGYNTSAYPTSKHLSEKSRRLWTVKETMDRLFKLQGTSLNPRNYEDKVPAVLAMINKALVQLGRMSPAAAAAGVGTAAADMAQRQRLLASLAEDDVTQLLRDWGLPQYADTFRSNGIDGAMLACLTETDLDTDFEVKNKYHRKKILQKVDDLIRDRQAATAPAPARNSPAVAAAASPGGRQAAAAGDPTDLLKSRLLDQWSPEDVAEFVTRVNLGRYAQALCENYVDGPRLLREQANSLTGGLQSYLDQLLFNRLSMDDRPRLVGALVRLVQKNYTIADQQEKHRNDLQRQRDELRAQQEAVALKEAAGSADKEGVPPPPPPTNNSHKEEVPARLGRDRAAAQQQPAYVDQSEDSAEQQQPGYGGYSGMAGMGQFGLPGMGQFGMAGMGQFGMPGVGQFGMGGMPQFGMGGMPGMGQLGSMQPGYRGQPQQHLQHHPNFFNQNQF